MISRFTCGEPDLHQSALNFQNIMVTIIDVIAVICQREAVYLIDIYF